MKNKIIFVGLIVCAGFFLINYDNNDSNNNNSNNNAVVSEEPVTSDKSVNINKENNANTNSDNTNNGAENKTIKPMQNSIAAESAVDNSENNNDDVSIAKEDLMRLIGNKKSNKWQAEYDLGVYDPAYDETWQDDMLSRAHQLVSKEAYYGELSIDDFECKAKQCEMKLSKTNSGPMGMKMISEFTNELKDHPAILKSGKSRNVYINAIKSGENGLEATVSIH